MYSDASCEGPREMRFRSTCADTRPAMADGPRGRFYSPAAVAEIPATRQNPTSAMPAAVRYAGATQQSAWADPHRHSGWGCSAGSWSATCRARFPTRPPPPDNRGLPPHVAGSHMPLVSAVQIRPPASSCSAISRRVLVIPGRSLRPAARCSCARSGFSAATRRQPYE